MKNGPLLEEPRPCKAGGGVEPRKLGDGEPTLLELAEMESRFGLTAEDIDPHDLAAAILRAQGGLGK